MRISGLFILIIVWISCTNEPVHENCVTTYFDSKTKSDPFLKKCLIDEEDSLFQYTYYFEGTELIRESYYLNRNGIQGKAFKNELITEDGVKKVVKRETKVFHDGKLDGLSIRYFNDSIKWDEISYKNGKEDGICRIYHFNGNVKLEWYMESGFHTKYSYEYDQNGKLVSIHEYNILGQFQYEILPNNPKFDELAESKSFD